MLGLLEEAPVVEEERKDEPPVLCTRCEAINIVDMLMDKTDLYSHHNYNWNLNFRGNESALPPRYHSLGSFGSLIFQAGCPVCSLLIKIIPESLQPQEEVLLIPAWGLERIERKISCRGHSEYASILYAASRGSGHSLPIPFPHDAADALCINHNPGKELIFLGGRRVEEIVNLNLVMHWMEQCSRFHPDTCKPRRSPSLSQIRLIDVESREVIRFPQAGTCDYLCLSYVWGNVPQKSYSLGGLPHGLPRTIEDSINLVRALGRRYLWVDSVLFLSPKRICFC
jgi:hypothetical protein